MQLPRCGLMALSAAALLMSATAACAQNYPVRPIRVISAEAGGGSDFAARVVIEAVSRRLGQQMIVDNRGSNGIAMAAHATPDGYTLLFYGTNVWLGPLMRKESYDPVKDLAPISMAVSSPNVIVVHPALPVKSVSELIALAKARPGQLNYASGGSGATSQLAAELFKSMAEVNIVQIPYRGNGPAVNALLGNEVQLMFGTAASVSPHVKSGRLRAIAITSRQPSALFPDLPTAAAALPGYESTSSWGLFAPAKTPAAYIRKLNQETVLALKQADVKEKFFRVGVETFGTTPEEFRAMIVSEMDKIGKVIKSAGIRDD